jgi:hypothetical protein
VIVVIDGIDLPGIRCGPNPEGGWYENIHVGLAVRGARAEGLAVEGRPWKVTQLFPGDADSTRWEFEVVVKDGGDFGGPFVRGGKGDRHIFLPWGELSGDGTAFELFRGSKLRLDQVDPAVVAKASAPGRVLVGHIGLTNAKGHPGVDPSNVRWSVRAP